MSVGHFSLVYQRKSMNFVWVHVSFFEFDSFNLIWGLRQPPNSSGRIGRLKMQKTKSMELFQMYVTLIISSNFDILLSDECQSPLCDRHTTVHFNNAWAESPARQSQEPPTKEFCFIWDKITLAGAFLKSPVVPNFTWNAVKFYFTELWIILYTGLSR